jgi:two-component system NarL family sensor kinase
MEHVASEVSRSWVDPGVSPGPYAATPEPEPWLDSGDALFSVAVLDDGLFRFDGFNPAAERFVGISNAQIVGRSPEEVLPPDGAVMVSARYRQCVRENRAISYLETLEFPNGISDWRTQLEPLRNEAGRIVRILGRARRIEAEDAAHVAQSEEEFRRALDIFPLGIALLDADGEIIFVNGAWQKFGREYGGAETAVGNAYVDVCAKSTSAGLPDGAEVAPRLRELLAGETQHFGLRYGWEDRSFVLRGTRFLLNGKLRVSLAHQDVTDLVSAQELAAAATEQLLRVQEEERAKIAMELHDSTSQHLAAIGLGLAALRRTKDPARVLDDMRRSLAEAQREIRTLTYLLYPPKLSSQGLVATLRNFVDGFRRRAGLSVVTTTFGQLDDLPVEVQQAVFRVVQEALANAHRHAQARRVAVEITLKRRGLRVTIADDGQNAPAADAPEPTGVGIRGMQARFTRLGGNLTVTHRPFGTVVDGFVPDAGLRTAV